MIVDNFVSSIVRVMVIPLTVAEILAFLNAFWVSKTLESDTYFSIMLYWKRLAVDREGVNL